MCVCIFVQLIILNMGLVCYGCELFVCFDVRAIVVFVCSFLRVFVIITFLVFFFSDPLAGGLFHDLLIQRVELFQCEAPAVGFFLTIRTPARMTCVVADYAYA